MPTDDKTKGELYAGLVFLVRGSFPKRCSNCGTVFETAQEFLAKTASLQTGSGLRGTLDDEERSIVEIYRNCVCGSTMMEPCRDRRDTSEEGLSRRERFGDILKILTDKGVAFDVGRGELLKVMRGEESALIKDLLK
ncbi:MAG: oxidoreductase [Deltaproteobacteria bacterium]|nr:oxidoreductase [Deltaproteobacteria bacterium]